MTKHRLLIAGIMIAAIVVAFPAVASAGSSQPDALIKRAGGSYKGEDVYNLTGEGQRVRRLAVSGQAAKFKFRVENDGIDTGNITLRGSGSNDDFRVRYKDSVGMNVTSDIVAGTTVLLASGESTTPFTILVTPKPSAPLGAIRAVKVTATFISSERDRVKAIVENGLPGE